MVKKLAIVIFTFLFLANIVVASAWAEPCLMNGHQPAMEKMKLHNMDEMPCHGQQDEQPKQSHCESICLCVHVSTSSGLFSNNVSAFHVPVLKSVRIMRNDDDMVSRSTSPPRRPPKYIS